MLSLQALTLNYVKCKKSRLLTVRNAGILNEIRGIKTGTDYAEDSPVRSTPNQIERPNMTPKLLKAPLYAVSDEWEHNGYDDSDFYRTMYDPNTDTICKVETGSTRYAGKCWVGQEFALPTQTPERVWTRAEQLLAEHIYQLIRSAELRDTLEPQDAAFGTVLRLTESHTHKDKQTGSKTTLAAGTVGEVFWCGAFGQFYRNGYNQPGRDNRRVGLRLLDGSKVFVPLKKCRLHKEPMTDSELRTRAQALAKNRRFNQCWGRVY